MTETDPTVLASVKDGVDWTEVTSIPAGFADGTDDGILTVNRNTTLVGDGAGSALGVNVGVAANQIVQLNGSAELPVVDGRNLTGLSRNTSLSDNVPTDGQVLIWDNINSWWEASTPPPTLNSGNGVTINSTNIDLGGALTATANITTNTGFNLVVDGINGEFITSTGTTSFNSSTINLGDAATDDIRVIGEFNFETGVNDLALIVNNQTNATPILRIPDLPSSDETLALQSEITNIVTGTANRIPKINASVDGLEDSDLFTNGVNNQLTVQHTATAIPDFVIHDAGLGDASMQFNRGGAAFFAIGIDYDDSDNFKISSATDVSSNEFVINRVSGNVGLGIGAPSRELHLHDGTGGMSFQMTNSASAGTAANNGFVIDYNDTDQRVDFIHYEGADIAFGDGVQNLYIDNSLNRVGVGINTPQGALDVELSNGSSFFRSSSNVTTGLLHVRHEGGGTGDASMKFTQIGPNFDYTMGIDRGDNNFKINAGTSLAANSDFTITSTGNVEIDQDATIRGNFTTVPAGVVGGTVTVTSRIMPLNADLDDINPGLEGQEVILIATGAININEGANMLLQGGAIGPVGVNSTLHMIFYSGQWIEVSRTIRP
ncbi:hypothetical protein [Ekhidna sp.]|uniref:hypothetical protein n=1 Tax=Ekhidna sp. TaxID=2608089 RepID=UPI003CCBFD5C